MLAVTVIGVRPSLLTVPAVKNGPIRARLPGSGGWRPGAGMVTCCRDAYWSEMSQRPRGSLSRWLAEAPAPRTPADHPVGPLTTGATITCATPRRRESARPEALVQSSVAPGRPASDIT